MDPAFHEALRVGARSLLPPIDDRAVGLLERFADRLLLWNRKVNLTAVTDPAEVAEKHLVDSLALLRQLPEGAKSLLDLGSGAGLPGVVIACVRRDLSVVCCDSIAKKVAFVKAVSAELGLNVRGVAVRAGGYPEIEGLPKAAVVVSRAVSSPEVWLPLGVRYLADGGTLFGMLGRVENEKVLVEIGQRHGLVLDALDQFDLPVSGARRAIARWRLVAP